MKDSNDGFVAMERWETMRSFLFVPAHLERFYESARKSQADVLVFDLEDSVPEPMKIEARTRLRNYILNNPTEKPTLVRVNDSSTLYYEDDVRELALTNVDGFVLPKVLGAEDVTRLAEQLDGLKTLHPPTKPRHIIFPLIETAAAIIRVMTIASASARVVGLIFGHEDFLLDMQADHTKDRKNLLLPRMMVSMAARATGKTPIDTPYLDIKNTEGCAGFVRESRELGFAGMLVLHPLQIAIANDGYAPSQMDIAYAHKINNLDAEAKQNNRNIAFSDGQFVAPPILKQAKAVLQRADKLRAMEKLGSKV